ncbi:CWC16 protein [Vararia minispora EC-137]|uniref:CWC16 protein n=1 Tax=Vararia minispora EC-137 TaxID=1314806 RepID=A0ACB8QAW9_9AGAM|nr:CWC16 protein [Vararia minispora EC-137]
MFLLGFNKYYPPDYDGEKHKSLNAYRGKHALGDRARKLDQGILITRFELPFNIWCGSCNAHIGMGVRYNAEKRKIGMYYSTPIFAFRCKCHLCSGWFEIQTDPQNTRYIVTEGARKKDEDWDPEENGGYAILDSDAKPPEGEDPLAALEKSTDAKTHAEKVQAPRLEQLQAASDRLNSDPYTHSSRVRKRFRADKKEEKALQAADDALKVRYGLPAEMTLVRDDAQSVANAHNAWVEGRKEGVKRRKVEARVSSPSGGSSSGSALVSLKARVLSNSAARRPDPFTLAPKEKPPDMKNFQRVTGLSMRKG